MSPTTRKRKRPADVAPSAISGPALRQRAETAVRENVARQPTEPRKVVAPEVMLHELRVYQVELELQNEDLCRAQAELNAERERYFDLYNLAPVGYVTLGEKGLILEANLTFANMVGVAPGTPVGKPINRFIHREDQDGFSLLRKRLIETGEAQSCEVRMLKHDSSLFWAHLATTVGQNEGGAAELRIVLSDITQRRQDAETIRLVAFYDPLTGLPNRRLLMDRLRQAVLTSARTRKWGALLFLDLDHFKQLNDTLGHDVGDMLLQQVSTRLRARLRKDDSVARLGGDEFVLLLEALSIDDHEAAVRAEAIAEKVIETLGRPYNLSGHTYSNTLSIGIVLFMRDEAVEDLLKKADVAMYQAKAAGRNAARFFDSAVQEAAVAHAQLGKDLRRGLAQHEFALHYQIQVDGNGASTGAEALARWNHAQRGMVSPSYFIPLAEETGVILPLGQWVLETACTQLLEWARQRVTAQWTMAVNVSASQLRQADFAASVARALEKSGANPCLLKLELTESMLVEDVDDIIVKMNAIKTYGVTFALDDFGTGHSSLSRLKRLPLDQLKIDRAFVDNILTDKSDAVIARTVVALGHSLGLKVIAEGVETVDQRNFLTDIGCDAFQGYLFGRPAPADRPGSGLV